MSLEDENWYDYCGLGITAEPTNWSFIYIWNFCTFAVVFCSTICLCFTRCSSQCGWIGIVTHSLGYLLTFAAVILTGVYRYNEAGKTCAENDFDVPSDPNSVFY